MAYEDAIRVPIAVAWFCKKCSLLKEKLFIVRIILMRSQLFSRGKHLKVQERFKEYTTRLHRDNLTDSETLKYFSSKAGRFYILPKIQKQGKPGRPIISSNGHPTERISEFVDYHLKPLVQNRPSFVKDTTHFLQLLTGQRPPRHPRCFLLVY